MSNTFEFVINEKTYTTKKVTPALRGRLSKITGYLMKEAGGLTPEELKDPETYPYWFRMVIQGVLMEHVPSILWDFLSPEAKTSIGTQEIFGDTLTDDTVGSFYQWAITQINQVNEQVKKTPITEESQPQSIS